MKKYFTSIILIISLLVMAGGCSTTRETKLTLKNLALSKVLFNFRASLVPVNAGETVALRNIPQGTYKYDTIYELPEGTKSSTSVGDVSGEINFDAGTEVLIVYTSIFADSVYTLNVSLSSNVDVSTNNGGGNPVGP